VRPMSANPSSGEETLWPRSAQVAAALLVLTTLVLLAWHGYLGSRSATRPTQLQRPNPQTSAVDPDSDGESEDDTGSPARQMASAPDMSGRKPMPAVGITKVRPGDPKINVNRATLTELQKLPKVGPTLAARIIQRREAKPFDRVEELRKVKGIGAGIFAQVEPFVIVGNSQRTVSTGN
jgi:competence ComEA-like helix-hairpin-helix protein